MIVIGADGGGTKTALAAYRDGIRIAQAVSGPLNYRVLTPEEAVRNLTDGLLSLGVNLGEISAVGIADPSLDDAAEEGDPAADRFYTLLRSALPCPVFGRSDAYITLFGLTEGKEPGVLVISGTGAMGIAENEAGEIRVAGGWGRLTGDEGSGYYIASESIRAALRAADGAAPPTRLTDALVRFFGAPSPRGLIPILYGDPAPDIAAFSREAAKCAEEGDGEALSILRDAGEWLARYAAVLVKWSGCRTVGIWGSVLTGNSVVRGNFEKSLRKTSGEIEVRIPPAPAEEAAARYAEICLNRKKEF